MDVKKAVQLAKKYIVDVLYDENIRHVATEEVVFNTSEDTWKVTVSFFRPEDRFQDIGSTLAGGGSWKDRSFKVIEIDEDGEILSMTHRTFPASN